MTDIGSSLLDYALPTIAAIGSGLIAYTLTGEDNLDQTTTSTSNNVFFFSIIKIR